MFRLWVLITVLAGFSNVLTQRAQAHVISQFYSELHEDHIQILFDVGYADPETRDDPFVRQPTREWLLERSDANHAKLRKQTEDYLREYLGLSDKVVITFPDFDSTPYDFPKLRLGGAYYRVAIQHPGNIILSEGKWPNLVIRMDNGDYLTVSPGESFYGPSLPSSLHAFKEGFVHVIPAGLDHILFILGIFLLKRRWRPILWSSLTFTAAHTITLGLCSAGIFIPPAKWVEPLIALSIAALAVENLIVKSFHYRRLVIIFLFGLIHGMGFASVLGRSLAPGENFFGRLICANLGVEVAQVVVLAAAWLITIRWWKNESRFHIRTFANASLVITALIWLVERIV